MKVRLTKEELEDLYVRQRKSPEDICQQFGCSRQRIWQLLKEHGIEARTESSARLMAIEQGKFENFTHDPIDEQFFRTWTPQMAWVLGVIFTDGCMYENEMGGRIAISSVDAEMLEEIRSHLSSTKEIKQLKQSYDKTKSILLFEFFREDMRKDLEYLGLTPRKSLTMKFPEVPKQFVRHFIRGCWDGDGSVFTENSKVRASYVCGSRLLVEAIVGHLLEADVGRVRPRTPDERTTKQRKFPLTIHEEHRSKNKSYLIRIANPDDCKRLFQYFYDGVDESMFLKRKYDRFVQGLSLTDDGVQESRLCREDNLPIVVDGYREVMHPLLRLHNSAQQMKCRVCGNTLDIVYITDDHYYCLDCLAKATPRRSELQRIEAIPDESRRKKDRILEIDNRFRPQTCSICGKTPEVVYLGRNYYCSDCLND